MWTNDLFIYRISIQNGMWNVPAKFVRWKIIVTLVSTIKYRLSPEWQRKNRVHRNKRRKNKRWKRTMQTMRMLSDCRPHGIMRERDKHRNRKRARVWIVTAVHTHTINVVINGHQTTRKKTPGDDDDKKIYYTTIFIHKIVVRMAKQFKCSFQRNFNFFYSRIAREECAVRQSFFFVYFFSLFSFRSVDDDPIYRLLLTYLRNFYRSGTNKCMI